MLNLIDFCSLSGMDGLSATKILRTEFPEDQRPTVIAMTAK
jgi:CheY-like chemotaxis protein